MAAPTLESDDVGSPTQKTTLSADVADELIREISLITRNLSRNSFRIRHKAGTHQKDNATAQQEIASLLAGAEAEIRQILSKVDVSDLSAIPLGWLNGNAELQKAINGFKSSAQFLSTELAAVNRRKEAKAGAQGKSPFEGKNDEQIKQYCDEQLRKLAEGLREAPDSQSLQQAAHALQRLARSHPTAADHLEQNPLFNALAPAAVHTMHPGMQTPAPQPNPAQGQAPPNAPVPQSSPPEVPTNVLDRSDWSSNYFDPSFYQTPNKQPGLARAAVHDALGPVAGWLEYAVTGGASHGGGASRGNDGASAQQPGAMNAWGSRGMPGRR